MDVLCSCDEPYLPHAATTLCSLLEHNGAARIHLFHHSIPAEGLSKLASLVERYGGTLASYRITPDDLEGIRVQQSYWSIANYFRLLAPRVLPAEVKKVLYLDSDIIIRRSLKDLWEIDLGDSPFAAVEDAFWDPKLDYVQIPEGAKYFNSGVMLINLDYWRQHDVCGQAINFVKNNPDKVNYVDQDALNAIFVGRWINLPPIWNDQAKAQIHVPAVRNLDVSNPAIVHFLGAHKPWMWSCNHPFRRDYRKYRVKTPWREFRLEGKPRLYLLRRVARMVLPSDVRQWIRSRVARAQA